MKRLCVGLIGLGEVAQIIHLPILTSLRDQFEVGAICDVSPGLLAAVGDQYGIEQRYGKAEDLVAQDDLDAVFVLNSDEYHADHTILACQRGKHVLVEKPMCLTHREVEEIIAARDASGVRVMVAYMRRFAPAFIAACEEFRNLDKVNYVRVRDTIGPNAKMIEQSSNIHRFSDIGDADKADRAERARRLTAEAIGEVSPELNTAYRMLLGLASHDLSAMREMIGSPRKVVSARQWNGGRFMSAIFEYDGYHATFEMGVDQQRRFDAHIEVFGATKQFRVQYDTPYIRHLPTTLTMGETVGDAYVQTVTRPTFKDPYTHELEYFHEMVTTGGAPKTTPEDFAGDLDLFQEIMRVLIAADAA